MTSPTVGKYVNFSKEDLTESEVKIIIDGIYAGVADAEERKDKFDSARVRRIIMEQFEERTKDWHSRKWGNWLDKSFGLDLALEFSIRERLESPRPFICSEDMSKAIFKYYINLLIRTTVLAGVTRDMKDYDRFRMLIDKFEYRLADDPYVSYS